MPRSRLNNWCSRQRLRYIEHHLRKHGWVNREALSAYFATERSLGSMDLTAYREAGGKLRRASAGETLQDGTVVVGYKLGGKAMYVAADDWKPLYPAVEGWDFLPSGGKDHADWLSKVMTAWSADHPLATASEVQAYFGIGRREAEDLIAAPPGHGSAVRKKFWEAFQ